MQVLINLITNAIKFTKNENKKSITISLKSSCIAPSKSNDKIEYVPIKRRAYLAEQTGDVFLQFAVTDTGCGLRPHEKELLFEKFSQASPRTHVQYGGSGLGLYICREIVELQGGQIGVSSTPHEGTTFAFFVKVHQLRNPPLDEVNSLSNPRRKSETKKIDIELIAASMSVPTVLPYVHDNRPSKSLASKTVSKTVTVVTQTRVLHILIVEDNIVNQKVLSKQLSNRVSSLGIANHGEEALAHLRKTQVWKHKDGKMMTQEISVILMDIEMPVMDGLTCTREIRKLQKAGLITRHIPIIAVTANARNEQISQIMSAGLDQVISKPFRVADLLSLIHRTLDQLEAP
ncbi:hsp90-like protein [Phlyctema vagabunda]|uniref:Hsp90-like protein n=1 Tax=Phlyctema vagabunda TaxID=108571 RepID=A0ABR4PLJ1_9HELO